ncbi:hypothetical protein BDV33DRAFT_80233 [Aspergillus novoparasiticus]|uniref:Uncharacterized protein n=1 Tax=Aspergillus novoparasiticus TaxID=986946 RepID=A0A5N6EXB0_9EURO|nr:hypothetical protein BDV33DRAFT_80233 [Aspergillus novoparasiticus]
MPHNCLEVEINYISSSYSARLRMRLCSSKQLLLDTLPRVGFSFIFFFLLLFILFPFFSGSPFTLCGDHFAKYVTKVLNPSDISKTRLNTLT